METKCSVRKIASNAVIWKGEEGRQIEWGERFVSCIDHYGVQLKLEYCMPAVIEKKMCQIVQCKHKQLVVYYTSGKWVGARI